MTRSEQAAIVNPDVIVHMEEISKHYPGVQALENVDFAVSRGEIRALIGENGAGKSTLIRLLTSAESPSAGQISVDGHRMSRMTPAKAERLGIGCVYQNLILAVHLTVAENVWLAGCPASSDLSVTVVVAADRRHAVANRLFRSDSTSSTCQRLKCLAAGHGGDRACDLSRSTCDDF